MGASNILFFSKTKRLAFIRMNAKNVVNLNTSINKMFNQVLNVGWTIIGFSPVCYFWFLQGIQWPFYLLVFASLASCFFPEGIYRKLAISNDQRVYRRLGVKFIRRFAQDGNFQSGRGIGVKNYLLKIQMFERYHFCCLIFFQASSVYACYNEQYALAFTIFAFNIIYNIYPLLLQQYNRIRILKFLKQHGL